MGLHPNIDVIMHVLHMFWNELTLQNKTKMLTTHYYFKRIWAALKVTLFTLHIVS